MIRAAPLVLGGMRHAHNRHTIVPRQITVHARGCGCPFRSPQLSPRHGGRAWSPETSKSVPCDTARVSSGMQSRALSEKLAGAKERNKRRICPLFQLVPPAVIDRKQGLRSANLLGL